MGQRVTFLFVAPYPKKGSEYHLAILGAFESRCIRRYPCMDLTTDTETPQTAAKMDMSIRTLLCQMRLKWWGHVFRMWNKRITKEAMTFDKAPTWKRPPGGIRTTWRSTVAGDLLPVLKPTRMRTDTWKKTWKTTVEEVAMDRSRWHAVIRDSLRVAGDGQQCLIQLRWWFYSLINHFWILKIFLYRILSDFRQLIINRWLKIITCMVWDVVGGSDATKLNVWTQLAWTFQSHNQFGCSRSLYAGSRKWASKKVNSAYLGTQNKMHDPK